MILVTNINTFCDNRIDNVSKGDPNNYTKRKYSA